MSHYSQNFNYKKPVTVVASGYFDFLHNGHIEYLEKSRALGDKLIVIVNNDHQTTLKKGKPLMLCKDRIAVVKALRCVDMVIESVDQDRSVCKTLAALHPDIFTNGGDQTNECIPEAEVCARMLIKMVDGLGAKTNSSSKLIERAKTIKNYKK